MPPLAAGALAPENEQVWYQLPRTCAGDREGGARTRSLSRCADSRLAVLGGPHAGDPAREATVIEQVLAHPFTPTTS